MQNSVRERWMKKWDKIHTIFESSWRRSASTCEREMKLASLLASELLDCDGGAHIILSHPNYEIFSVSMVIMHNLLYLVNWSLLIDVFRAA